MSTASSRQPALNDEHEAMIWAAQAALAADRMERPLRVVLGPTDTALRQLVRAVFARANIELVEATSGAELLTLARSHPDVMLLEWPLPDAGLELVRALVEDHGMRDRVVIMSALRDHRDFRSAFEAGASRYLVRPVDPRDVLQAVEQAGWTYRSLGNGERAPGPDPPL